MYDIPKYKMSNWSVERAKSELDKCVLLCSNCHREVHANIHDDKNLHKLNISYTILKNPKREKQVKIGNCKFCKTDFEIKENNQIFCSHKCHNDSMVKINIKDEELKELVWKIPSEEIGKMFGVSGSAISKRCKKLGISKPPRGYWTKQ